MHIQAKIVSHVQQLLTTMISYHVYYNHILLSINLKIKHVIAISFGRYKQNQLLFLLF